MIRIKMILTLLIGFFFMKLQFHEEITLHEYHFFRIRLIVYNAITTYYLHISNIIITTYVKHTLDTPCYDCFEWGVKKIRSYHSISSIFLCKAGQFHKVLAENKSSNIISFNSFILKKLFIINNPGAVPPFLKMNLWH